MIVLCMVVRCEHAPSILDERAHTAKPPVHSHHAKLDVRRELQGKGMTVAEAEAKGKMMVIVMAKGNKRKGYGRKCQTRRGRG